MLRPGCGFCPGGHIQRGPALREKGSSGLGTPGSCPRVLSQGVPRSEGATSLGIPVPEVAHPGHLCPGVPEHSRCPQWGPGTSGLPKLKGTPVRTLP